MQAPRAVDARTRQLVEAPCRVATAGAVSPVEDAAQERAQASFNPDELAAFLHDGEDKLARRWGGGSARRRRCRRRLPPPPRSAYLVTVCYPARPWDPQG